MVASPAAGTTHAPSPVDQAAFEQHTVAVAAVWWPRIGWVVAAAAIGWWPLDAWLYPDSPHVRDAMGWMRPRIAAVDVTLAVLLPRIPWALRHAHLAAFCAVALNLMIAGHTLGALDDGGIPGLAYAHLVPLFSVPLVVPLVPRVLAATGLSAAAVVGWWAHPWSAINAPGVFATISFLVFSTLVSIVIGHMIYALIRQNFHLQSTTERQRAALSRHAEQLEVQVRQQTAGLERLHRRARDARATERRQIARDMHDSLGQELLSLRLLAGLGREEHPNTEATAAFQEIESQVARVQRSLRQILTSLRPERLVQVGVGEALSALAQDMERRSGLTVTSDVDPSVDPLPDDHTLALYRIAQEGIANALRHGRATTVRVAVERRGDTVRLTVSDDGQGIAPDEVGAGLGTIGIRERAVELGGHARWTWGDGTVLEVELPVGVPA